MAAIHKDFLEVFNGIAPSKHRYTVFTDLVTMMAISLHNAVRKDETLEAEYLRCIKGYKREDQLLFPKLLALFVEISEVGPYDHFGQLFMELSFSEDRKGQFFTPPELAEMMARMTMTEVVKTLDKKAFVTVSEPACGAGSMLLASVKVLLEAGYNPANVLWIQAVDIDRVSALMCYIQLTLWHVPAEIIVGNALTLEYREHWYTPSHYLGGWQQKLAMQQMVESLCELEAKRPVSEQALPSPAPEATLPSPATVVVEAVPKYQEPAIPLPTIQPSRKNKVDLQIGFDFS